MPDDGVMAPPKALGPPLGSSSPGRGPRPLILRRDATTASPRSTRGPCLCRTWSCARVFLVTSHVSQPPVPGASAHL